MGNDGGSIPTRRELVKEAARNPTTTQIKETRNEQQGYLWTFDSLSQKPLARPVVSDALGRLFNKESVLEYLLPSDDDEATKKTEQATLIDGAFKSLKDVVEVRFEVDESEQARNSKGNTMRSETWICPITREELGPGSKAVYLVPCGHAFAGTVVKEVSGERCPQCNEAYASNDIIPILSANAEDIARLSLRRATLRDNGLSHSLKKASGGKKRKKAEPAEAAPASSVANPNPDTAAAVVAKDPEMNEAKPTKATNGIKNTSTANLTARVLEEQDERSKRRKMEQNANLKSLFAKKGHDPNSKERDISFMNRGYAIPGRR